MLAWTIYKSPLAILPAPHSSLNFLLVNMEADAPPTIRSKPQILMETWGTLNRSEVYRLSRAQAEKPNPAIETWAKLKIPYQAPSCPPLPSWSQIRQASKTDNLHHNSMGSENVCRIGDTVIKYSGPNVVDVCRSTISCVSIY